MRKRVKTEVFAELSDPVLFPRVSDAEIEQLAERGERRTFETDELLFEHGMRDAPFFVIEHGTVDIVEHRLEEDLWFPESSTSLRSRPARSLTTAGRADQD